MKIKQIAAALAVCLTAGVSNANPKTVIDDSQAPQYLFTMAAKSGTFVGDELTLEGVPLVVYFTDRPHRMAGHMDLKSFVEKWDEGVDNFNVDPPNAGLSIYEETGDQHAVLIISTPEVTGDSLSLKVKVMDEQIPQAFRHATLFIDNFRVVGGRL